MLHVPSYFARYPGYFADLTPEYFSLAKLPYDFDEAAPEPKHFIDYCEWQWTDADCHLLLEETLGDILLADPAGRGFLFLDRQGWGRQEHDLAELAEGEVGEQVHGCAGEGLRR